VTTITYQQTEPDRLTVKQPESSRALTAAVVTRRYMVVYRVMSSLQHSDSRHTQTFYIDRQLYATHTHG